MQQVNRTMLLMLTHSWVSLIIIGFLFVFFIFAQAGLALGPAPEERVFRAVIMINLVMSTFLGVYFAG
ncbi:MAG: hypothetical protein OQJ89_09500, partial [Kangiellaceae bacterium]|nr:hypothetical protein [Kangiellaceae bacterium]